MWNPDTSAANLSNACKQPCITPEINNGYFICLPSQDNATAATQYTCMVKCRDGYEKSVDLGYIEVNNPHLFKCGEDNWVIKLPDYIYGCVFANLPPVPLDDDITTPGVDSDASDEDGSAKAEGDAGKDMPFGQNNPSLGMLADARDHRAVWIATGSGVFIGVLILISLLTLHVTRCRKQEHPTDDNPPLSTKQSAGDGNPPLSAKESAVTLNSAT